MLLAQDHGAEPVERGDRDPRRVLGQQPAEPLAHLLRGSAGECDRQAFARSDPAFAYHVCDPVGERTRLARAGPGHNEQRTRRMRRGGPLIGIEPAEERAV